MSAQELGQKLVDLCSQGKFMDVIENHYADDIVSIEAAEAPGFPRQMEGIAAIKEKNQWWANNNEVHSLDVKGPFPHGDDRFAVVFNLDVTCKDGPMAGQRSQMSEVGIYTIKNDKVAKEEFFYGMG